MYVSRAVLKSMLSMQNVHVCTDKRNTLTGWADSCVSLIDQFCDILPACVPYRSLAACGCKQRSGDAFNTGTCGQPLSSSPSSSYQDGKPPSRSYDKLPAMAIATKQDLQAEEGATADSQKMSIIFLRQPTAPTSSDPYLSSFKAANFSPHCINVLEQNFVNIETLTKVIESGPSTWAGIIATSARSCEAWVQGAKQVQGHWASCIDWSHLPLFVPGLSTCEPMEKADLPVHLKPALDAGIRASPPGSAARLADFILAHTSASTKPFLFLAGDKTLPELPDRLRAAGRHLTLQQVYETGERPGLRDDLRKRFDHEKVPEWLAFFAPSSARMVLDHLETLNTPLPRCTQPGNPLRLAAIGQTTSTYLKTRGLLVGATAENPTPSSLLAAIQQAEQ